MLTSKQCSGSLSLFAIVLTLTVSCQPSTSTPAGAPRKAWESWWGRNAAVLKKHNITTRTRVVPDVDVPLHREPGKVHPLKDLSEIEIASGVKATVTWGRGTLLELVTMEAGAEYPTQTLDGELITVVTAGSGMCDVSGKTLKLEKDSILYLPAGNDRSLRAGADGLEAIEVFSPVRRDHLKLAGVELAADAKITIPDQGVTPNIAPLMVHNLKDIQWTQLIPPEPGKSTKRSAANSRLIWGKNAMLSFISMDPNAVFPLHIHPEDQLMIVFRGSVEEGIMDTSYPMTGEAKDTIFQPGHMAHSGRLGELGADVLDVFWPVRPDYMAKAKAQYELYGQVIAPGTRPKKLADEFTFAEGSAWINGALYFSDMYFRDHRKGDWTGDAAKSRTIRMDANGTWKTLTSGMQTNGTIVSGSGNLLVCDMFGHRVVELDPKSGEVVKTVLDTVNGKPIDGPNDLVMDAKGGLYVSDPQFTPEKEKNQPGKQVYYVAPDGTARVVIPAGEFAMPNGVEISPDGKTFYVDNTWYAPGEHYVWAYDIADDGSLSNKRKFAALNRTPDVLAKENPADRHTTVADGMAVDTDGRIYVTTLSGVQIFNKDGVYVGTIWCPGDNPANCGFGGKDGSVLYMVGGSSAWAIQTKVKGFRHPGGFY